MPKLFHLKSRDGCQMCKSRRIKCDEVHPACGACARHGVFCEYSTTIRFAGGPKRTRSEPRRKNSPARLSPMSTNEDHAITRSKEQMTELHLMHHYTGTACKSPNYLFAVCRRLTRDGTDESAN